MSEWQPIATVPKDGTKSMLVRFRGGGIAHVYLTTPEPPLAQTYRYASGPMCGQQAGWPDHWMPLPDAPDEREYEPGIAPCDDAEFGMSP